MKMQVVWLPLTVPEGRFCRDIHGQCARLVACMGEPLRCTLSFGPLQPQANSCAVLKPAECLNLEVEDGDVVLDVNACPGCGETRTDWLIWQDDETVYCLTCGNTYPPPRGLKMAIPTLSELLAEGQRQLAAQRAAEATRAAIEASRVEAAQLARRATVMTGIATIVPEALMPFIQITVDECAVQYEYADLELPDCTPIRFGYDIVGQRCYTEWRVARARGVDWTGRDLILCEDLLLALAQAAEQGAQERAARAVQEAQEAEDAAYAQATRHAELVAVPQRTPAEWIEAYLRQIVRDEMNAAAE